jgi:hypothetical protein
MEYIHSSYYAKMNKFPKLLVYGIFVGLGEACLEPLYRRRTNSTQISSPAPGPPPNHSHADKQPNANRMQNKRTYMLSQYADHEWGECTTELPTEKMRDNADVSILR